MHHTIASKDFSRKTLNALARAGVMLVGCTFAPGADGSFANGARVYQLVKNGCSFIRSFTDVLGIAQGKVVLRG